MQFCLSAMTSARNIASAVWIGMMCAEWYQNTVKPAGDKTKF